MHHLEEPPNHRPQTTTWALNGRHEAILQSREYVRAFLGALDPAVPEATVRDALLVVSELVTNAVLHAPGPCTLHLAHRNGALVIAVRDSNPAVPVPRVPDPAAANGGLGWHLLSKLTTRIDVQTHADGGKTVTAVLGGRAVSQPHDQR